MKTIFAVLVLASSAFGVTISGHVDQPIMLRTTVNILVDRGDGTLTVSTALPNGFGEYSVPDIPKDVAVWVYPSSPFFQYTPTIRLIYVGEQDVANAHFVGSLGDPGSFAINPNAIKSKIMSGIGLYADPNLPTLSTPHVRP
jgi:hypothetical protein